MRGWPNLLPIVLLLATLGAAQAKPQLENRLEPSRIKASGEAGLQIAQRRGGFSAPSFRPSPPVYRPPAPIYRPPTPSYQSPAPTIRPQVTTPAPRQPAFRPQVVIPPPGRVAAPPRIFGQPQANMPRLVPRVGGSSLGDRMAARAQQGLSGRLAGRGILGLQATRANRIAIAASRPNVPTALGVRSIRASAPANSGSLRGRFATAAGIGLASATGSKVMAGSTGGSGGRCDRSHPDYPRCATSNDNRGGGNRPSRREDGSGERGSFQVWATGHSVLVGRFAGGNPKANLHGVISVSARLDTSLNEDVRRLNLKVLTGRREQANELPRTRNGERINAELYARYSSRPFDSTKFAGIITTKRDLSFVRLAKSDSNNDKTGGFMMRRKDLYHKSGRLLTPSELKDKFALSFLPRHVVYVKVPTGTKIALGYARAQMEGQVPGDFGNGRGGGFQIVLLDKIDTVKFEKMFRRGYDL